jgi:hypothetical protein
MKDFKAKVKAAEREAAAKYSLPQSRQKRPAPKGAAKPGDRRSPRTEFQPGVSGNPGGRPKKTPITDEFRILLQQLHPDQKKYKGKTYAQVLAEAQFKLAIDLGDMSAAKEIADRVEGKVPQKSEVAGPDGSAIPFVNVSPEENERKIAEILSKAGTKDGNSD